MLIEFSVKNFRSIKNKQTLSMVAGPGTELLETNTVQQAGFDQRVVRSAALYGPNGAGKTNFLHAIQTMKRIVVTSAKEDDELAAKPFLFNKSNKKGPTEFQAVFLHKGVRYQYGYAATRKRIVDEWLVAFPTARAQRWYDRSYNKKEKEEHWHFGGKLVGNRTTWRDATRKNALFLSTAVMLNSEQLRPVYEWFDKQLVTGNRGRLSPMRTIHHLAAGEYTDGIHRFMHAADVGITGIDIKAVEVSMEDLAASTSSVFTKDFLKQIAEEPNYEVSFIHTVNGMQVPLEPFDESAGTNRLFGLAGPLMDVFENGHVLIVDELSNSLHPLMTRFLIGLFHDKAVNKNGAQLIFATHDTSNFNEKVLRRDQIWLLEASPKDRSTRIVPLTDFKPRKDVEALERNYLMGRYGALPYIEYPGGPQGKPH